MDEENPEPQKSLWRNGISTLDLLILKYLREGYSPTTLDKQIKDELAEKGYSYTSASRGNIIPRIRKLIEKGVIKNAKIEDQKIVNVHTVLIDPIKLYDYIFFALIKIRLGPKSEKEDLTQDTDQENILEKILVQKGVTWRRAFEIILEINKKYHKPVKILFNIGGTGEYDFGAFIYTSDINSYHKFKSELLKLNIIEKFDSKYIESSGGFYFDPIDIPYWEEIEKSTSHYSNLLNKLTLENKRRYS